MAFQIFNMSLKLQPFRAVCSESSSKEFQHLVAKTVIIYFVVVFNITKSYDSKIKNISQYCCGLLPLASYS